MEIVISYDTKTKKKKVMMGGKEMKNVASIGMYNYDKDTDRIEITTTAVNEDEGVYERHCIYAADGNYTITKYKKDAVIADDAEDEEVDDEKKDKKKKFVPFKKKEEEDAEAELSALSEKISKQWRLQ